MTTFAECYKGNYIEATDLSEPVEVVIEKLDLGMKTQSANGQTIDKPILFFKGAKKAMICNKTNMKRIVLFYAGKKIRNLEDLAGVKIRIGTEIAWNPSLGAKDPCVRVLIPKGGE